MKADAYGPVFFWEDRYTSRSERYTYIPTITVLESLQREGLSAPSSPIIRPAYVTRAARNTPNTCVCGGPGDKRRTCPRNHSAQLPMTGTSSYQMLPGYFRFVCQERLRLRSALWEKCVFRTGETWWTRSSKGLYEVVGVLNGLRKSVMPARWSLVLPPPARQARCTGGTGFTVMVTNISPGHHRWTFLTPRRQDYSKDLWSAYRTIRKIC